MLAFFEKNYSIVNNEVYFDTKDYDRKINRMKN